MSDKTVFLKEKVNLFVDLKYISETIGEHFNEEQAAKLETEISNAFANIEINMGDKFIPFMDNIFVRLKDANCDLGEREFETSQEFDNCMNNMKIFGAELIDNMF